MTDDDLTTSKTVSGWEFELEKMNSETFIMLGQSMALAKVANLFGVAAENTLGIGERKTLEKVSRTLCSQWRECFDEALRMARECGAVKQRLIMAEA